MTGARRACRVEPDAEQRMLIVAAAVFPSETVYYVAGQVTV